MGKANPVQQNFWIRNDDGSETSATFMGSQDSNQTIQGGTDNRFRIRFAIEETAGGTFNDSVTLYVSRNAGAYSAVTTGSTYIKSIGSKNTSWTLTDEDATTEQLTVTGSPTFTAGYWDDDGATDTAVVLDTNYTEYEFCVYIDDNNALDSDFYDFRVYDSSGTALGGGYNSTPRVTASIVETPNINVNESVGVVDSETVDPILIELVENESITVVTKPIYYDDNIIVTDKATVEVEAGETAFQINENENISVADSETLTVSDLDISENENISVADVSTVDEILSEINENENISVADVSTVVIPDDLLITENEGITVVDSETVELPDALEIVEDDPISVTDTPTVDVQDVTWEINVNDNVNVADAEDALLVSLVIENENISVADVESLLLESFVSENDDISVLDSATIDEVLIEILEDQAISVSDISTLLVSDPEINENENISVADSPNVNVGSAGEVSINVDDTVSVADSEELLLENLINQNEGIFVVDSTQQEQIFNVVEDDTVSVADAEVLLLESFIIEDEAVNVADAETLLLESEIDVNEDVNVSDTEGIEVSSPDISTDQPISVTDSPTVVIAAPGERYVNENEDISITENVESVTSDPQITSNEGISVVDTPTVELGAVGTLDIDVNEDVSIAETDSEDISDSDIFATDSINVNETVNVVDPDDKEINENEDISLTDVPQVFVEAVEDAEINTSESIGVADSPSIEVSTAIINVNEGIVIVDGETVELEQIPPLNINVNENISVTEFIDVIVSDLYINTNQNISISEAIETLGGISYIVHIVGTAYIQSVVSGKVNVQKVIKSDIYM